MLGTSPPRDPKTSRAQIARNSPQRRLEPMRIGVDLGGTKIEIVALGDTGEERYRHRMPTPTDGYQAIVDAIVQAVAGAERSLGETGTVGVGTPGALSRRDGLLRNANTVCLNGKPFDRDLGSALGRPVRIANDANCFALSEASDGAAQGAEVVFGVILGTGTGGGLVVAGRLLTGVNAIAGEWGHNPLPWPNDAERPGPACYCGKRGCIETFLCGPALVRDHGGEENAQQIAAGAAAGETRACDTMARYVDRLARSLASIINVVDPDVIVLGGGLSNIEALYRGTPEVWPQYVFSDAVDTRLVRAEHGDSGGVRGAAWLWEAG